MDFERTARVETAKASGNQFLADVGDDRHGCFDGEVVAPLPSGSSECMPASAGPAFESEVDDDEALVLSAGVEAAEGGQLPALHEGRATIKWRRKVRGNKQLGGLVRLVLREDSLDYVCEDQKVYGGHDAHRGVVLLEQVTDFQMLPNGFMVSQPEGVMEIRVEDTDEVQIWRLKMLGEDEPPPWLTPMKMQTWQTWRLQEALNKISTENEKRIIAQTCEKVRVKSPADAKLLARVFFKRAVNDHRYLDKYARILKALLRPLQERCPGSWQMCFFPADLCSFNRLLSDLEAHEQPNFLDGVLDELQRRKYVAIPALKFLGNLVFEDLWDPRMLMRELLATELDQRAEILASCRKGRVLCRLLGPYLCRPAEEVDLHLEYACALVEVLGEPGLDALGTTGCFRAWVVRRLADWQGQRGHGEQRPLGTRTKLLLQNILDRSWTQHCLDVSTGAVECEQRECRIDPCDGQAYALSDLLRFYRRRYTDQEIRHYFAFECRPLDAMPERQSRSSRRPRKIHGDGRV